MEREELLKALRRTVVQTGSLCCLGCGYEHNCSIHGCTIIRAAMEEIMQLAVENEALRRGSDAPDRPMSEAERDACLLYPSPSPRDS